MVGSGLNQQQFVVLKEIQEKEPVSQKQICGDLLFEKSNVSKIVKKLITDNLVQVVRCAKDGRVGLLTTTKKGTEIINYCMAELSQWNSDWLDPLPDEDIISAVKALEKISNLTKKD